MTLIHKVRVSLPTCPHSLHVIYAMQLTTTGRVNHIFRWSKHFESGQWQKQEVALAQSKPGPKFV
jgi:hypothetical protein